MESENEKIRQEQYGEILTAMSTQENEELSKKQRKDEKTVSRGFRASKEVQDKFHEIIDNKENGEVDDIVNDMCNAYMDKQFKKANAPRAKEIEQMEQYLSAVGTLYKSAIDGLRLAENNIRQEFAAQLDSLTDALAKAQQRCKELEKTTAEAVKASEQAQKDAAAFVEKNKDAMEKLQLQHEADVSKIEALQAADDKHAAEAAKAIAEAQVEAEKRCVALEKEISKLQGKIEVLEAATQK